MQTYGLMLADNGSCWYFQGTRDGCWRNHLLDQLMTVPASAVRGGRCERVHGGRRQRKV
jgi:hypothetical protein